MESRLELVCDYQYGKTTIKNLYYTPPYKIMHPFMDGDRMEVILMSGSAGLLAGDRSDFFLELTDHAKLTFLSQSYEKILDTRDEGAERRLRIKMGENAVLKYMPFPVIPFANSSYAASNEVRLAGSSTLIFGDIISCGRVGMGEKYGLRRYVSKTKVYVDGRLAFADHTFLCPAEIDYAKIGMWGGYTHNGMLYIYRGTGDGMQELSEKIRACYEEAGIFAGVTMCPEGILVRSLGYSGDELYDFHRKIAEWV